MHIHRWIIITTTFGGDGDANSRREAYRDPAEKFYSFFFFLSYFKYCTEKKRHPRPKIRNRIPFGQDERRTPIKKESSRRASIFFKV